MTRKPSKLKLNARPVIRLPENCTTGYKWEFDIPDGMEIVSDDRVSDGYPDNASDGSPIVGKGRDRRLILKFVKPGKYKVVGEYVRPFDPDNPLQTEIFKYHVE